MKVTVNNGKIVKDRPYPKLMVGKLGVIVLMWEYGKGTCLNARDSDDKVGKYYDNWRMEAFTDFEGSLTIENDEF